MLFVCYNYYTVSTMTRLIAINVVVNIPTEVAQLAWVAWLYTKTVYPRTATHLSIGWLSVV